jgi:histidinol-phosphate aminotransferase
VAGLDYVGVPLRADLTLDLPAMLAAIEEHKPVITWLGYPNNPTGTLYEAADVLRIIEAAALWPGGGGRGLPAVCRLHAHAGIAQHNNLVVMRTVSKLGLAGIRLGYLSAAPALLRELDKVRPPYNVNMLTEAAALFALEHLQVLEAQAARCAARVRRWRPNWRRWRGGGVPVGGQFHPDPRPGCR